MKMATTREIKQIVKGLKTSDGDGVQLTRIIGTSQLNMLDPFLLFDAFGSDKPQDYIGGFPPHPHRGFETVTYMLKGKMRHQDSAGHSGVIAEGGVQWMTAGKGIIHSEMPEQEDGLLAGLQLWVNLPAANKMVAPKYQEQPAANVPEEVLVEGLSIKVIAGETKNGTKGIIENEIIKPIYWDVNLNQKKIFNDQIPVHHNAFIYVIEGELSIGTQPKIVQSGELAVLTDGHDLQIEAIQNSRFLVIAGKPLNEAVERAGPFVMNTKAELQQAFADYQSGNLA